METTLRSSLAGYHVYNCRLQATINAGAMLAYPYPGAISWEDNETAYAVTISAKQLAAALADGGIIAPTSSTLALCILPVFRWTPFDNSHAYVSQLILCNFSDSNHMYLPDTIGPRLFTKNPIEFYS